MTSTALQGEAPATSQGSLRRALLGALVFSFWVWLPFFLFSMMEVALGHTEPLLGGLVENALVMTAMGFFYSVFVIGPSLLLSLIFILKKASTARPFLRRRDLCFLGFLGGACELLLVQNILPLNALTPEKIAVLLAAVGIAIALLLFLMAKAMFLRADASNF